MKKLSICSQLNLHSYPRENISEYIRAGLEFNKKMGFECVDFSTELLGLANTGWQERTERAIADSNEIGLDYRVCHLPFIGGGGVKDAAYFEMFDRKMHNAIDAAVMMGVDYAVIHPNAATVPLKSFNRKEQFDTVMAHLTPYAEHASKVGLNIVVENMRVIPGMRLSHRYCQTPDELCEVADALGIGVCWDFGHANISGIKQSEGLAYVGKRLKVIHVNDNGGIDDDHIPPFIGNVDWKDAMHGLALAGYDGVFNFEIATARLPAAMKEEHARYLVNAARELMGYIE